MKDQMSGSEKTRWGCGIALLVLAGFMLLGIVANAEQEGLKASDLVGFLVVGVAPAVGGLWLMRSARQRKQHRLADQAERNWEARERAILQLARQHGGRLTAADVAMHTDLTTKQAQDVLSECNAHGLTEVDATDDGGLVYVFKGLSGPTS